MATNRVLFISNTILKDLYVLDTNIDDKILNSCIYNAQTYYIYRLLGTRLYQRVWNEIDTNSISTAIKTLLDNYIEQCLTHYAMSELYKHLSFRLTNKGVVQKDSEQSTKVDYETLNNLRDEEINKGNYFARNMIRYLVANNSLYPEYMQANDYSEIFPALHPFATIGYGYGNAIDELKDCDITDRCYKRLL